MVLVAGLDTRAFRLPWPKTACCFEIDRAALLHYKETILDGAGARPQCVRRTVEADLTGPWADALLAAGFDPGEPSGWLLEGLLFYLSCDDMAGLLEAVTKLASMGSRLGFEIVNGPMLTSP
jgi:methyltransferase (TIGR00027 family)